MQERMNNMALHYSELLVVLRNVKVMIEDGSDEEAIQYLAEALGED